MFAGIVQALGRIDAVTDMATGKKLLVDLGDLAPPAIKPGDSIAVSGVCLTATEPLTPRMVSFDVIAETLRRSTLGERKVGDRVNLEPSLKVSDAIGGHFVQGHVDAVAEVLAVRDDPADWLITFGLPALCRGLIVPKGSVALDGVSMTVASVGRGEFSVAVIPTTREKTTLGLLRRGMRVNLETDILARTVVHYLRELQAGEFLAIPQPTEAAP